MMLPQTESRKGYTLIELIVVVGIVLLVASFGIARYSDYTEKQTVKQAADTLTSNLHLIQAKALAGEKPTQEPCTTLVGYRVIFDVKSYQMVAVCSEGERESTRVTVDLPGNVNLYPVPNPITYYALGKGTSSDEKIYVTGRSITVPLVLSAGSITTQATIATVSYAPAGYVPQTPTPTRYSCPWPAGDPRCGSGGATTPDVTQCTGQPDGASCIYAICPQCQPGQLCSLRPCLPQGMCQSGQCIQGTPTPTLEGISGQFACQLAGGSWTQYPSSCHDECSLVGVQNPVCLAAVSMGCDCGADKCWDGGSCVSNPTPTPTPNQAIPNCTIGSGPTTLILGQTGTYTGSFTSSQGNLSGQVFLNSFVKLGCSGCRANGSGIFDFGAAATSGAHSWTYTPTASDVGTQTVSCRAWNDAVAECRPPNLVDSPPRYSCVGPAYSITVTVATPTPTLTPTPTI